MIVLNEPSLGEADYQFKKYKIIYMDEFVDLLLREEVVFGISLPHMPKRYLLEEQGLLQERHSPLLEIKEIKGILFSSVQKSHSISF